MENRHEIYGPRVVDDESYVVTLHEIGHILGHGQGLRRLDEEVKAWVWAIKNAVTWTERMTQEMRDCLLTYILCPRCKRSTRHPIYKLYRASTRDLKRVVDMLYGNNACRL